VTYYSISEANECKNLTIFTENLQFSNTEMCEQEANLRMSRKVQRRAYEVLVWAVRGERQRLFWPQSSTCRLNMLLKRATVIERSTVKWG